MENPKRLIPSRGRAALLASACLLAPLFAGEPANLSGLAARELAKRGAAVEEAQMLLLKGDEAYKAARYQDAVQAYSGARDLIPEAAATLELRASATQRYLQASVEYGRELSRKGDVAGAKTVVDKALDASPSDPAALDFRAQLDDPIRTNPALTAEHAKTVDEVRRLLYTAEGAYNLGKFDEAKARYEDVLRLDRYNKAARRGLEQVTGAKSAYLTTAYDHARAVMLTEVDEAMSLPLTPVPLNPDLPAFGGVEPASEFITVSAKLKQIIIPQVALEQTSLSEAIDFLRAKSAEVAGDLGSVNFTVDLGDSTQAAGINATRFNLRLSNTPLSQVLKYITEATRTSFTTDQYSVIIKPMGSTGSNELITHVYKVPPDFVSSISPGASVDGGAATPADPFGAPAPSGGLLARKLTAQEALTQQGVAFPDGALAIFNPVANTLNVRNTAANQDIIAQIIETTVAAEPVMVITRVTMIRAEQTVVEELGFDWLLDNFSLDGNTFNVSGGSQGSGGSLEDIGTPGAANNPITAGNRSGQYAIDGNSIDNLIAGGNTRGILPERAPGVLAVRRIIDGQTVTAVMRGLSQKKGVDMMTCPSTVSRSGQASRIQVIREFIYPTEYEPPELPQTISSVELYVNGVFAGSLGNNSFPVTPATPTAFTKRDVGVVLDVVPTADANKQYVDVALNPSITDFDGFVNYGTPINAPSGTGTVQVTDNAILMPVFSRQSVSTNLSVRDGYTMVIGGLMRESVQNVEDKTPVLGDVPFVGRFFQSKARQPVTSAIIFLVNVELVDPTGRPYRNH